MILLIAGLVLWTLAHLYPCIATGSRQRLRDRLGNNPYRGLFSLAIVASLIFMVMGWRHIIPEPWYNPPAWGRVAALALMLAALLLLSASNIAGNLKRWIRHPQLTGVAVWALAHLLANGENRSVLLFGVFLLWALTAQVLINRRDGAWQKPPKAAVKMDIINVVAAVGVYALLLWLHPILFNVSPHG
jgi:uncharacterized membrane protein